MFKDNFLVKAFREREERKRIEAHHEEQKSKVIDAIQNRDTQSIASVVKNTEALDQFIRKNYDVFLRGSIKIDDVSVFKDVSSLKESVSSNYIFYESQLMLGEFLYISETPLLVQAITSGAKNISTLLANDPSTDILKVHYTKRHLADAKRKETYSDKPSVLAEKYGMNDVAAILLTREANALTHKAKGLKAVNCT